MKEELIKKNIELKEHGSFRIGGRACHFAEPSNCEELTAVRHLTKEKGLQPFFFGFGSNLLFPDTPKRDNCYISLKKMNSFSLQKGILTACCGMPLSLLAVLGLLTNNSSCYEFTYLLPGSIGAGLFINARYHDREIADIVEEIHYLDLEDDSSGLKTIKSEDCQFDYKSSIFQDKNWLIVSANFSLPSKSGLSPDESDIINEFLQTKTSSLTSLPLFLSHFQELYRTFQKKGYPLTGLRKIEEHRDRYRHFAYPSAGSVFKNSRELGKPVGQIIDELGLKGLKIGNAMISPHHGNIIINRGQAQASDVINIIDTMSDTIFKTYGIKPLPEIIIK